VKASIFVVNGSVVVECRWDELGIQYGDCYEVERVWMVHIAQSGSVKRINARKIKRNAKALFRKRHSLL